MFETNTYSQITTSSNRSFGFVFTIFFLVLIAYFYFSDKQLSLLFFLIPILLGLISIFRPKLLERPNKYWLKFGLLIGLIISPIILSIIYFGVLFPISILLKLLNKDVLDKKINSKNSSFWKDKKNENDFNNQY